VTALAAKIRSAMSTLFIGTYTSTGSRGIYALPFDPTTGALGEPTLAAEAGNPTFLAFSPDKKFLYAVHNSSAMAIGYAADIARGALTPLPAAPTAPDKEPCYVAVDPSARALVGAHYHQGYAAALPLRADGTVGAPSSIVRHAGPGAAVVPQRQEKPHVHCTAISPDGRFVLVCDLGLDKIFSYALDAANAKLAPAAEPFTTAAPGTGPRHATFSPGGRHVFVIGELGNTIAVYVYDAARGSLALRDARSTLPVDFHGKSIAAAVRVHPNGRFVYGSNRGHDSIAVFAFDDAGGRLASVEIVAGGGRGPRDFALSPDGRWLVVAHQLSDSLAVFRVDPETGRLALTSATARIAAPVCVLFAD